MPSSKNKPLTVLHTSDWHLGRLLHGHRRHEEFAAFLDWLAMLIEQQHVDIVLVSGDIFDTTTPGNRSQEMYYRFLARIASSGFRHIVITSGNHDSPSFLDAPGTLLSALRVHVVGTMPPDITDEVLLLEQQDGSPLAIVCAVPYLRERDLRSADIGDRLEEKEQVLRESLRNHYAQAMKHARNRRENLGMDIPIIMMGHLFVAGASTSENEAVNDLLVGSLGRIPTDYLPSEADYLALGHLHIPQKVAKSETIRYSGSPLSMTFGEARQQKSLCLLRFNGRAPEIELLPVPKFQVLLQISGNRQALVEQIDELLRNGSRAWLEVNYTGDELIAGLREELEDMLSASEMEILVLKDRRIFNQINAEVRKDERLEDLDRNEVFNRCLEVCAIPEDQRHNLRRSYQEILVQLDEEDTLAQ